MKKAPKPQVVTGNDLMEGDVIYLRADGSWTRVLQEAAVAHGKDAAGDLLARGAAQAHIVVGPYLANVALDETGTPVPEHLREDIRTKGPTIRTDLGKQADLDLGGLETARAA